MKRHAGDEADDVDPDGADPVVVLGRIHDPFGDAEAYPRGQPPGAGPAPSHPDISAEVDDQGECLAELFAEPDAAGEPDEAEHEVAVRIIRRGIREPDELGDVEHDQDDAPTPQPDP